MVDRKSFRNRLMAMLAYPDIERDRIIYSFKCRSNESAPPKCLGDIRLLATDGTTLALGQSGRAVAPSTRGLASRRSGGRRQPAGRGSGNVRVPRAQHAIEGMDGSAEDSRHKVSLPSCS